ncbi:MAG: fluoride efflux transporter CrcB [Planctomycetia bacterium]|nr:fluoride efflux transporter CrcB [Planctomycetia bacterium]
MLECLCVGLGGFLGALGRYLFGLIPISNTQFPFTTLLVNLLGSILIGIFSEYSFRISPLRENVRLFLQVGLCGGFTTFSTFSLETMNHLDKGRFGIGFLYVLLSVGLCLFGIILGRLIVRSFH